MKKLLFTLALIGSMGIANAQWVPTSLNSENVLSLVKKGTSIFAGTNDGIYRTFNNGISWDTLRNGFPTGNPVRSITLSGTDIFATTDYAKIFLSTDNGTNWINPGDTGLQNFPAVCVFADGANLFSSIGNIYLSVDNGVHWTVAANGLLSDIAFSFARCASYIFAGTSYGVAITDNNGALWIPVNNGFPYDSTIMMYPGVNSLVVSGTTIYAGTTGKGVFVTTNFGTNWDSINTGLINKNVRALAISGNSIFAGTQGGVYFSSNFGANWVPINTGLTDTSVYSFVTSGDTLFAGTLGGLWWRKISDILNGVETVNRLANIEVYPNPAIDKITVETTELYKAAKIFIFNTQGQMLKQQEIKQIKTDIDIRGFAKGVYILRLNTNDKTEVTRFVKE
jgi:hypothetical protein